MSLHSLRKSLKSILIQVRSRNSKKQMVKFHIKEEELTLRLKQSAEQLETNKATVVNLSEKLEAAEVSKDTLEKELKKLRVQTEQWRKAADAAAAVLAGDINMSSRRISERCGSMDKHYYEAGVGGYAGFVGSPGLGGNNTDDDFEYGKSKGSSIRMLGDLWKKKSQK